jgi:hypothetical protein
MDPTAQQLSTPTHVTPVRPLPTGRVLAVPTIDHCDPFHCSISVEPTIQQWFASAQVTDAGVSAVAVVGLPTIVH